jgi:hypothetical protein
MPLRLCNKSAESERLNAHFGHQFVDKHFKAPHDLKIIILGSFFKANVVIVRSTDKNPR